MHEFRLLKKMRHMPDRQNYTIEKHVIANAPQFSAFSYTWGTDLPSRRITIDSAPFCVRENLWQALEETWDDRAVHSYIWVDAICIDQNNTLERNHQVDLMSDIFKAASRTIAWLGPGTPSSEVAMYFFGEIASRGHVPKQIMSLSKEAIIELFSRPYFRRMRIIQEILLSRHVIVKCGDLSCLWNTIKFSYVQMRSIIDGGIVPRTLHFLLSFNHRTSYSLDVLLYFFEQNLCADPRDKVFALLSLIKRTPRGPKPPQADYTMSEEGVIFQTTQYIGDYWDYWDCWPAGPKPGDDKVESAPFISRDLHTGLRWPEFMPDRSFDEDPAVMPFSDGRPARRLQLIEQIFEALRNRAEYGKKL